MKNSGRCPKCGSCDILRVDGYTGPYGSGSNIKVGTTFFSTVSLNRYICCSCGYTEAWIDQEDIEKVKSGQRPSRP